MKKNEIVLDLMDTCQEALLYVKKAFEKDNLNAARIMLLNIKNLLSNINKTLIDNEIINNNRSSLYCNNGSYSIDKVVSLIKQYKKEKACQIFSWEVAPLCQQLSNELKFELNVLPYKENWEAYRIERERKIKLYSKNILEKKYSIEKIYRYEVSIVVTAYNKLEYTKAAIESIFEYTDFSSGRYELITLNNGSSDGTEEYFDKLPHIKKINLKYNILGNTTAHYVCEGKYVVGFSNDAVATRGWLTQLLRCITSDERIAWVVPTCNADAISNMQGVKVPYSNRLSEIKEIQKFAQTYNHSNPDLWEERMTLMPFVAVMRSDFVNYWDGIDRLYVQAEFADDDMATSFRRAGLKQILAKDTFLHHFGSITLRDEQKNNASLENMRNVYYNKWGVDAWDGRAVFVGLESCLVDYVQQRKGKTLKTTELLLLEPRFGGSLLQIKNYLKKENIIINKETAIVFDQRYKEDAMGMFKKVINVDIKLKQTLDELDARFDIISSGEYLNNIISGDIIEILEKLYKLLKPGGMMIFPIQNYQSTQMIKQILISGGINTYGSDANEFIGWSFEKLQSSLKNHPYFKSIYIWEAGNQNISNDTELLMDLLKKMLNMSKPQMEAWMSRLESPYIFMAIFKDGVGMFE